MHIIETRMSQIDMESDDAIPPPQAQTFDATTKDAVQLETISVIKDLQQKMKELKKTG